MLVVYGHIYSDTTEKFEEVIVALENAGFQIAYDSQTNATIIKEAENEQEDTTV